MSGHVLTVFSEALERRSAEERAAYLQEACRGDDGLRARVGDLLRAHQEAGRFLQGDRADDSASIQEAPHEPAGVSHPSNPPS